MTSVAVEWNWSIQFEFRISQRELKEVAWLILVSLGITRISQRELKVLWVRGFWPMLPSVSESHKENWKLSASWAFRLPSLHGNLTKRIESKYLELIPKSPLESFESHKENWKNHPCSASIGSSHSHLLESHKENWKVSKSTTSIVTSSFVSNLTKRIERVFHQCCYARQHRYGISQRELRWR